MKNQTDPLSLETTNLRRRVATHTYGRGSIYSLRLLLMLEGTTTVHEGPFINYVRVPRGEGGLEKSLHTLTLGEGDQTHSYVIFSKANWIGRILRRNCLLHDAIEGQITEVKWVGRRRRTQLLDNLRNRRRHWELKKEAEDRKRWRRQFINRTCVSSISP